MFCRVVSRRLRIISLSVSFRTATSPLASTRTCRVRSPSVTAVATSAMARTWLVRLAASWLTLSVRSFQTPPTSLDCAWPPSLPSTPTSRATRVTSPANGVELVDHRVDGVLELEELALDVDRDLLAQVAVGHRGGHLGDVSHLAGQVAGHQVDVVGQVLPDAADLDGHRCGLTELALGAHLAGDPRDLGDEAVELVDHRVDRVLQLQHLAADVGGDLLAQVAVGDRADHALHLDGRAHQRVDQAVHRLDAPGPALRRSSERHPLRELALLAHHAADPGQLRLERLVGDDDVVETVGDLAGHARPLQRHASGEIPLLDLGEDAQQDLRIDRIGGGRC